MTRIAVAKHLKILEDAGLVVSRRWGRWIGGSVRQWVDELTTAVLEHHAAGFIYRSPDDTPAGEALARWATEVVPAVHEAITRVGPASAET